ncbi:MAG: protein kinase, partial [Planctomycetota bacterium]
MSEASGSSRDRRGGGASWRGKRVGKYRLLRWLGHAEGSAGGAGVDAGERGAAGARVDRGKVFSAEDTARGGSVVLRLAAAKAPAAEGLLRAARAASQVRHPGVVEVHEIGEVDGFVYVAMEAVEGGSVAEMIRDRGPLPAGWACGLAADAAEGLAYAQGFGVVHGGLDAEQLLVTRAGRGKVAGL